jgi:hypothetical protein
MRKNKMSLLQKIFDKNADIADAVLDFAGDAGDRIKEHKSEYVATAASFALMAGALPFIAVAETAKLAAKVARKPLTHTARF